MHAIRTLQLARFLARGALLSGVPVVAIADPTSRPDTATVLITASPEGVHVSRVARGSRAAVVFAPARTPSEVLANSSHVCVAAGGTVALPLALMLTTTSRVRAPRRGVGRIVRGARVLDASRT